MKAVLDNRLISSGQRGVGLLEVLIALVVFALGVISMAQLQLRTMSLTMDSTQRSYAVAKSQDIADRIRSNGIAPVRYLGTYSQAANFCASSAPNCANGGGLCTADMIVAFELNDVFCTGEGSYQEQILDWEVTIGCERPDPGGLPIASTLCDELGAQVVVESSWFARSFDDDLTGADAARDSMTLRFAP